MPLLDVILKLVLKKTVNPNGMYHTDDSADYLKNTILLALNAEIVPAISGNSLTEDQKAAKASIAQLMEIHEKSQVMLKDKETIEAAFEKGGFHILGAIKAIFGMFSKIAAMKTLICRPLEIKGKLSLAVAMCYLEYLRLRMHGFILNDERTALKMVTEKTSGEDEAKRVINMPEQRENVKKLYDNLKQKIKSSLEKIGLTEEEKTAVKNKLQEQSELEEKQNKDAEMALLGSVDGVIENLDERKMTLKQRKDFLSIRLQLLEIIKNTLESPGFFRKITYSKIIERLINTLEASTDENISGIRKKFTQDKFKSIVSDLCLSGIQLTTLKNEISQQCLEKNSLKNGEERFKKIISKATKSEAKSFQIQELLSLIQSEKEEIRCKIEKIDKKLELLKELQEELKKIKNALGFFCFRRRGALRKLIAEIQDVMDTGTCKNKSLSEYIERSKTILSNKKSNSAKKLNLWLTQKESDIRVVNSKTVFFSKQAISVVVASSAAVDGSRPQKMILSK